MSCENTLHWRTINFNQALGKWLGARGLLSSRHCPGPSQFTSISHQHKCSPLCDVCSLQWVVKSAGVFTITCDSLLCVGKMKDEVEKERHFQISILLHCEVNVE